MTEHQMIIMCGHGSPGGLFNVSNIGNGVFAISSRDVFYLCGKRLIAIWCNADQFVRQHNLNALYSGMFVSEVAEASCYSMKVDQYQVDESNNTFALILGYLLSVGDFKSNRPVYEHLLVEYNKLAQVNPVAQFNFERLYLTEGEPVTGVTV